VYEEFATVHCAGRINPPVVCAEAEEAVLDLKHSLQSLSKHTVRAPCPLSCHFITCCYFQSQIGGVCVCRGRRSSAGPEALAAVAVQAHGACAVSYWVLYVTYYVLLL
jgi:hypothetical protein